MEQYIQGLEKIAGTIRYDVLQMLNKAGSGHAGGSLSVVETLTFLYFSQMRIDPQHPNMKDRDRFILSKGHSAPALYAALAGRGYFGGDVLDSLRQIGSILQGHPDMKKTPGVDFSSGSLGQGLSVGCGMAWGLKARNIKSDVYVLLGDGELNEGQIWEAVMAAAKFKLDNLIAVVDNNGVQLDGTTDEIMPLGDIAAKWKAFGWHVAEADGHNMNSLADAFISVKDIPGIPKVIIARTVKGKGVSFMENDYRWHGKPINDEEFKAAVSELMKNN